MSNQAWSFWKFLRKIYAYIHELKSEISVFEAAGTIFRKCFDPNRLQSIAFWSTYLGKLYITPESR